MTYTATEILQQLDAAAEDFDFPMRDNVGYYPADIKMTVFRGRREWLIAVQELAYAIKDKMFVDTVFGYGNSVPKPGVIVSQQIVSELEGQPFFGDDDSTGRFLLDPMRFSLRIRGQAESFELSEQDYAALGIDVGDQAMPSQAKVIRLLSGQVPDRLFLVPGELLALVAKRADELDVFLELDGWHNPDLAADQLPSDVPCLQRLALAIERGDAGLYHCGETEINTHWSNWEWYRDS